MNMSNFAAPVALVLSTGAIVATGALWNTAQSETDPVAPLRSDLRSAATDLDEAKKRIGVLEEALAGADERIAKLVKQDQEDEMLRQCAREFGQQAQGMTVQYGYASPDYSLSAPCTDWLYNTGEGDGEGH